MPGRKIFINYRRDDSRASRAELSRGTSAQRAAFLRALADIPCPCGCGMNMYRCLMTDLTCPVSPPTAQNLWVQFLAATH